MTFQPDGATSVEIFYTPTNEPCNYGLQTNGVISGVDISITSNSTYSSSAQSFFPPISTGDFSNPYVNWQADIGTAPSSGIMILTYSASKTDEKMRGVSISDCLRISQHVQGTNPFVNPFTFFSAEVDGLSSASTGQHVTMADVQKLVKIIQTVEDYPANVGPWRFIPRQDFGFGIDFCVQFESNPFNAINFDNENYPDYCNGETTVTVNALGGIGGDPDFYSIKTGDVTRSLVPGFHDDNPNAIANERFSISSEEISIEKGDVELLIKVNSSEAVAAFQTGIYLNSNLFSVKSVKSSIGSFADTDYYVDGDELRLTWFNKKLQDANSKEFIIRIIGELKNSVSGIDEIFELSEEVLKTEFVNDNIEPLFPVIDLQVKMNVPDSEGTESSIFPNPTTGEFTILFEAEETTEGRIQFFNLDGRVIQENNLTIVKGENTFFQKLPINFKGTAICRISYNNKTLINRVVKL